MSKPEPFPAQTTKSEVELGTMLQPKFGPDGMIPCITVDNATNEVLMFAYMNAESLSKTIETRKATYWSRSRGKLWVKGEESGNVLRVTDLFVDCDQDVILLKVENAGPRRLPQWLPLLLLPKARSRRRPEHGRLAADAGVHAAERAFDPATVYRKK